MDRATGTPGSCAFMTGLIGAADAKAAIGSRRAARRHGSTVWPHRGAGDDSRRTHHAGAIDAVLTSRTADGAAYLVPRTTDVTGYAEVVAAAAGIGTADVERRATVVAADMTRRQTARIVEAGRIAW